MSKYVENNLQSGEEIIVKARINKLAAISDIIFMLIVIAVLIVLQVLINAKTSDDSLATLTIMELIKEFDSSGGLGGGYIWYIIAKLMWIPWIIGIGILIIPIISIIDLFCTDVAATNKRVIGKTGIVATKTVDIAIGKVDTVQTTFFGRIFKYYTLKITGGGNAEGVSFDGVVNANEIRNEINNAIERHAEDQRKAQAAEIASAMNGNRNVGD